MMDGALSNQIYVKMSHSLQGGGWGGGGGLDDLPA